MSGTRIVSAVALLLLLSACPGVIRQRGTGRRSLETSPPSAPVTALRPTPVEIVPVEASRQTSISLMDCDRRRDVSRCSAHVSCPWMSADYAWATELVRAVGVAESWTASIVPLSVPVVANGVTLGVTNQMRAESVEAAQTRLTQWSRQHSWVCECGGHDACAKVGLRGYARIGCGDGECGVAVVTGADAIAVCATERDGVARERSDDTPGCVFPSAMPGLARCGGQSGYVDGRTILVAESPECRVLGSITWRGAGGDRTADIQDEALLRALRVVLPRVR